MKLQTDRPIDLAALLALTVLAVAAALVLPEGSALRVALALPFLLLAPGYALVAALFPERGGTYQVARGEEGERVEEVSKGLDPLERAALSLGLSIAVVPLLGLALNFTPWGIRLVPILVATASFILAASSVAFARRRALPPSERLAFRVEWDALAWRDMRGLDRALTVLLALSVVAALGSLAYVLATPRPQETFTEFYVLGPGGKAEGYPSLLAPGAEATVIVGVVNHEGRAVQYDWDAVLVTGTFEGEGANRSFVPQRETPIDRRALTLDDGAKEESNWTFRAPTEPGEHRLELRLAKDGAPETYRRLHLWIEVR